MDLQEEIKQVFAAFPAKISETNGLFTVEYVVAERTSFLSKKKLVYIAKYRIDAAKREVRFTELLRESGSGLSGGGGFDSSPGFGFRIETYTTGSGPREGTIEEQSNFFGATYTYTFDFRAIRGCRKKSPTSRFCL
ncbi:MAG: hypothetical protein EHM53_14055 [Methanoregulaceae archaeon]|nr:MAG: hypothetical protein EHM53_14055 [Methanoregulaceae archaeon]